jgi:hypothetical protein
MSIDPVDDYAALMVECEFDPYKFVMAAFPWGESGTELASKDGPRAWQKNILDLVGEKLRNGEDMASVVRTAVASGHGIGKSALVAWLILWAMATKPDTRGVVTANTSGQLEGKTWAEVAKWHSLFIGSAFFTCTATALYSSDPAHTKNWRIDAVPWSVDRTESFAGLHNEGKRILIVFDEASSIDDLIWEVTEGALTDEKTQIVWATFGNPTRNNGRFRECFRNNAHRWDHFNIDSRTVDGTNKKQLDEFIEDHGIDSDFVKVRILGQFPNLSENTLLTAKEIAQAVNREVDSASQKEAPNILGCDVARDPAGDQSVIARRRGRKLWFPRAMRGSNSIEVADALVSEVIANSCDAAFVDMTGGHGCGVYDHSVNRCKEVMQVYFNGKSSDPQFFNKRTEIIWKACMWVKEGGSIPDDKELREELACVSTSYKGDKLYVLAKDDMKKVLGRSPDKLDAFALTFSYDVAKTTKFSVSNYKTPDWDIYAE